MGKYLWSDKANERRESRRPKKQVSFIKIKPASKKRAKQNREYQVVRIQYLIDHSVCEIQEVCKGARAVEVHHSKGREGSLLTDTRYFKSVCRACHNWELKFSKEAKEKGYSLSRLTK